MCKDLERCIGKLEGKIDLMLAEQQKAIHDREHFYKEIARLNINDIENRRNIDTVLARIGQMEKPISDFNKWHERAIGAAIIITFVAAIIGGSIATFWQKILNILRIG